PGLQAPRGRALPFSIEGRAGRWKATRAQKRVVRLGAEAGGPIGPAVLRPWLNAYLVRSVLFSEVVAPPNSLSIFCHLRRSRLSWAINCGACRTLGRAVNGAALDLSLDQLCQRNFCGLRAEPCEITTLTRAGPRKFMASSRASRRFLGSSTKKPLPP